MIYFTMTEEKIDLMMMLKMLGNFFFYYWLSHIVDKCSQALSEAMRKWFYWLGFSTDLAKLLHERHLAWLKVRKTRTKADWQLDNLLDKPSLNFTCPQQMTI